MGQPLSSPCQCHFAFPGHRSSLETWGQGFHPWSPECMQFLCARWKPKGLNGQGKGVASPFQGTPKIRRLCYVSILGIMYQDSTSPGVTPSQSWKRWDGFLRMRIFLITEIAWALRASFLLSFYVSDKKIPEPRGKSVVYLHSGIPTVVKTMNSSNL